MFYKPILLPLLAQVLLTFLVWVTMYATRFLEIGRKNIDPQHLADAAEAQRILADSAGPANNLRNLFEMPVLFYAAILLSLVLLIQDPVLTQLAWGYVALRAAHSLVQCTYNRVLHRFTAYFASCVLLLLIWLRLGAYVLSG